MLCRSAGTEMPRKRIAQLPAERQHPCTKRLRRRASPATEFMHAPTVRCGVNHAASRPTRAARRLTSSSGRQSPLGASCGPHLDGVCTSADPVGFSSSDAARSMVEACLRAAHGLHAWGWRTYRAGRVAGQRDATCEQWQGGALLPMISQRQDGVQVPRANDDDKEGEQPQAKDGEVAPH